VVALLSRGKPQERGLRVTHCVIGGLAAALAVAVAIMVVLQR